MSKTICYPVSSLDKKIAQTAQFKQAGYVPSMVANLRAVYDSMHAFKFAEDHLDDETIIADKLDTLDEFRKKLRDKDRTQISNTGAMYSEAFLELVRSNMKSENRRMAADIIAQEFSRIVSEKVAGTKKSKAEICKDEFSIFEEVYNTIEARAESEDISDDDYDFLKDILDNFGVLSVYSRVVLKNTENLILGSTKSYAATATDENWEEVVYEDFYNADEETKESWQEQANTKSAYSRVSGYVRHILSSVEVPGVTVAGYPIRYPGQQVHQHLANLLRGISDSKRMMTMLEIASEEGDVIAKAVLTKISEDPMYQRCMYASFKHGFTPYSETKADGSSNSIFSLNNPIRNFYNNYIHAVTSGEVLANSIFYKDTNTGEILVDTKKLNALAKDADKFVFSTGAASMATAITNISAATQDKKVNNARQIASLTNLVFNHLTAWGIDANASTVSQLLSKARTRNAILKAFTDLYSKDGVHSLIAGAESLGINLSAASLITKEVSITKGANEVKMATPVQKALSKLIDTFESVNTDDKYPSTARAKSKKGKDTIIHSNHPACFMTDFLDPIIAMAQENNYQGIKDMLMQKYRDVAYFFDPKTGKFTVKWLQDLVTADSKGRYTFADNFEHTRTVQHTTPTGNIISVENTTEQQKWNILATMYSSTEGSAYDNACAWYPVFVLGDSGSYRWIKAPKYSIKTVIDGMFQVFKQECLLKEEIDSINNTITTGSKIQFGTKDGSLAMLPFLKYSDKTATEDQIKSRIQAEFDRIANERLNTLETQGLIAKDKDGNYVDKANIIPKGQTVEDFVRGWVYNSEFATMNQFQLMTISPSFYKDSVDLQKRYKEIHASGSAMDVFGKMTVPSGETVSIFPENVITAEGAYETVAYFKDIEILPQEVHDYLVQIIGNENSSASSKYAKKSTLTDGQGYRTLDSYRRIAMAQGRWNEKGPEEAVYKMIKELGKEGLSEERKQELREKIAASRVVFQVEKPFLFTHEKLQTATGSSVYIPVQHKCSEMVLIPELLPEGSNLRSLGLAMRAQGLDAVYSTTVVKVGMFGETDLTGLNGFDTINTALSGAKKHSLNLANYYRQQNVPEHVNQSRQLGTQVMKMPFVDLDLTGNTVYDYYDSTRLAKAGGKIVLTDGRTIDNPKNGRGVARFYNALICSGIMDDLKKFLSEVKDTASLGARMQQVVLSNSRNTIDSLFAYSLTNDNKFLVPLMELGVEHDAMSLLLSWFRKQVLHRTIAGGSAVQASAYGIAKIETDEVDAGKLEFRYTTDEDGKPNNITWMQAELTWDLTYTDISGNTKELDYYKYCNNDGTLKTNSKGEILLDIDYPGIRNIVAYRIPTENNYSVMNLEVIRFTPKTSGGVIKVPLEGTTIAGFDFK